jgi:hypothetical protein
VAGVPTVDLATVADAGGGTLQKTAFDAYGRKTGTSASTTSDLPEGSRLYFTASRVLATVLAGLSTVSAAVITSADTVILALGKLQGQISANLVAIGLKADKSITISAGSGLSGGGDLSSNRSINISNTAVTPSSYGDATHVATFTVNAQGQLTAAGSVAITSGGGAVTSVFGRTGVIVAAPGDYTFAQIGSKPTTLAGYGITDAASSSQGSKADSAVQSVTGSGVNNTDPRNPIIYSGSGAVSSVNGQTGAVTLTKVDVGLGNADNTSDANKPVSTAQASAIALKIGEAPSDGNPYVRINGAWVAVTGKMIAGSAIAPASHANQTSVAVSFGTTFSAAPKVFIEVTSGAVAGSGALVSYLSTVATTTGCTVYFDLAEGAGSPSTIDNPVAFSWVAIENPGSITVGGGGTWGSITGTLSSQADLQAALNSKANSGGTGPGTDAYVSNVIGLYPMDTRTLMGYVNDVAGATITLLGGITGDSAIKRFGKNSLSSNGQGIFFNTPISPCYLMGTQDFTWEVDFQYRSLNSYQSIMSTRPSSGAAVGTVCFGLDSAGSVYCFAESAYLVSPTAVGMTPNVWHNGSITSISGVGRFFIDGNQVGANFTMPNLNYRPTNSGGQITFGADVDGTEHLVGSLANGRITLGTGRYAANYTPATDQWPFK